MKPPILIIALMLVLGACGPGEESASHRASKGVLDLSDWDLATQDPIALAGEWEFYWSQLLSPGDIATTDEQPQLRQVPAIWTEYGDSFPVTGYATYRLEVQVVNLPGDGTVYGLLLDGQGSSFRLWVNGELVATDGDVATELAKNVRGGQPQIAFFESRDSILEFVMQISNFSHRNAGFRNPLLLGNPGAINELERGPTIFQWTYLGILLVIALYHYYLFSQRREEGFLLHFANLCLLTAIRMGFTGNNVLVSVFPFLDWEMAVRIEYLTFFLVTPVFAAFMRSLYPEDVHLWFLRASQAIAGVYSIYIILVSTLAATYVVPSYQIVLILESLYFLYFLLRLFRLGRDGRFFIGAATLAGLVGLLSEILFFWGIVPFGEVAPFGMVGFVLVQAVYLTARYAASLRRVEELSVLLERKIHDLKESESKYRTIFEDSKDMIFIADLGGRIEEISPACIELFGYTPEEIKANGIRLNAIGSKEDRSRFARLMSESDSIQDFEFELQHRDGRQIRALMNASTRVDNKGNIIGIQGTVRDISDRVLAQEQRRRADKLELIAATDALTQACTRRYFEDVAEREMARSLRNSSPLSLVMLDIDFFKKVNDTHGHLAGDKVLVALANLCRENIRSTDVFCRFGGEEFIILMPETDLDSAFQKIEELRTRVAARPLVVFNGQDIAITFSAGLASWHSDETLEDLIGRADKSLYQAKQQGRNRSIRSLV
ncbi:MAG: diguanylate cyclase [Proteobacteria bacterium]|nr:diguanylate cyclase [Pseudomonadota bacterium]MDA0926631.1 diguanylate cyclase [Pseudomonadota bacterium]